MAENDNSLATTPTWAVAAVCFVLVLIAILTEHILHLLTSLLKRKRRKTLNQALYSVKAELRSFGFMSLVLNLAQQPISKICISERSAGTFLPCKRSDLPDTFEDDSCPQGRMALLSGKGTEQLQLFIIMLAVFHIHSSLLTFGLGTIKMKRWESWEEETRTLEYQLSTDPRRIKLTRETSFGRRHLTIWNEHPLLLWLACFFRQFKTSVSKADYLALRYSFITGHFPRDEGYDFNKFLKRSLDEDFTMVVGISYWSWAYAILFIFFNAQGFHSYFWLPVVPLLMLLAVGTKLEVAITKMCLDSSSRSSLVPGTLRVTPNNSYFWFGRPRFLLRIIHFILFQNAFQVAFFVWTWFKFGFPSCFHRQKEDISLSIGIGGLVQILCAYVTLPLHVLVTRVGSSRTEIIFTDRIIRGLRNWRRAARKSTADSESRHAAAVSPGPPDSPSHGVPPADHHHSLSRHDYGGEPEVAERPWDLPPPTGQPVQEIVPAEETEEASELVVHRPRWKTTVPAGGELAGDREETAASSDGSHSYDGEASFAIWELQLQQQAASTPRRRA